MLAEIPKMDSEWLAKLFKTTDVDFEGLALSLFQFQYQHNLVYQRYVQALHIHPESVNSLQKIPFLPISFFKSHSVICGDHGFEAVFESSGTTNSINSKHYVKDLNLYHSSFVKGFQRVYGNVKDWCIIGLLPAYLERSHSSLVVMVNHLIAESAHPDSGFYLYNFEQLHQTLLKLEAAAQKVWLIGVTFALMDFAEQYPMKLQNVTVIETGGMKGRKEEITREAVHGLLQQQLGLKTVHSEYGMTELLSQAYSSGEGRFLSAPWMNMLLRAEDDPFDITVKAIDHPENGVVNVIDLANVYSCAFIATDDVGRLHPDQSFEILGRLDASDIRGCSLLAL